MIRRFAPTLAVVAFSACNEPPTQPSLTLEPAEPTTLSDLVATWGDATDPNQNDVLTYAVAWFRDDQRVDNLTNESVAPAALNARGEVWRVEVSASDGDIQGPKVTAEVEIGNAPPTATVSVEPLSPKTDDKVRTKATKQDPDGDAVSLTYRWTVNGSVTNFTGETLPEGRTEKGQTWEVAAIPSDGLVDGEPGLFTFVIANTPPKATKAEVTPTEPDKRSTLACIGSGWEDVDEDAPGYEVAWTVNGANVSTSATLDASALNRGDKIRCVATPFDGDDRGAPLTSNEVVLRNTPPSLGKVEIGPEYPLKSDVVTATVSGGSDPDGDALTYQFTWLVNGVESGTTPTLPSSRFLKDDTIRLQVRAFDGTAYSDPVTSNSIRAGNNPPAIDLVSLLPAGDVFTDSILTAETFTSDPDGDVVKVVHEWIVNGTKVAETGEDLDGDVWFKKGDTVYVKVTPDDGEDDGATVSSASVTIANSKPIPPVLKLSPAEPTGGEKVECRIDTPSTDADEDSVTYTFRWEKNGTPVGGIGTTTYANDTFPSGGWTSSDDIVCVVTAFDGTASSIEARLGTRYGSKNKPGLTCKDIKAKRSWYTSGAYWIDPDADGDYRDAYEVWCDMVSDGGGWTLTYYADAAYFDGYYIDSTTASSTPPKALNDQKDVWNVPSELKYTETMLGCTTQNDASTHWWRYTGSSNPHDAWSSTSSSSRYFNSTSSATQSSGTSAVNCFANYKGASSSSYGFAVAETNSSCGSCNTIMWGMYHYSSSSSCNSTSTTYGTRTSKWRSVTQQYPVCNRSQTSNGKFWIGVR